MGGGGVTYYVQLCSNWPPTKLRVAVIICLLCEHRSGVPNCHMVAPLCFNGFKMLNRIIPNNFKFLDSNAWQFILSDT